MSSILEKAIVHLLNEEQDKAEALFHQFMVEKARKIHESIRDADTKLAEGWDDEIDSEEYMTEDEEDDLSSVEDDSEEGADEAADDLENDMDVDAGDEDVDVDMSDEDGDVDVDVDVDADVDADVDSEGTETTDDRLDDIEAQLEKLTAEFDKAMEMLDHDGDFEDGEEMSGEESGEDMDNMGDEGGDTDGEDYDFDGFEDDDEDMANRMEDDVTDKEDSLEDDVTEGEDMEECDMDGMTEGKMSPQFKKMLDKKKAKAKDRKKEKDGKKEKKEVKEDELMDGEDEDLDDITESVIAELEKVSMQDMTSDGMEVGTGKKIKNPNWKSSLEMKNVDKRGGAQPVPIGKGQDHTDYNMEPSPTRKQMGVGKNIVKTADGSLSKVPPKGSNKATLNTNFAGPNAKNDKSAID